MGGVAPTAGSNITIGVLNADAHVDFTGTATMASVTVSANGVLLVQSGTLTVTGSTTVQADGLLKVTGGTYSLGGTGTNNGSITVDGEGAKLRLETGSTTTNYGGLRANQGTLEDAGVLNSINGSILQASNTGIIHIVGVLNLTSTNPDAFTLTDQSALNVDHNGVIAAKMLSIGGNVIATLGEGSFTTMNGVLTVGGQAGLTLGTNSTLVIADAKASVLLNAVSNQTVRIAFGTVDGTAHSGVNYTAVQGFVDIPSGGLSATIDVAIAGTSLNPGLSFKLALNSALSALLGDLTNAQASIPVDRILLFSQSQGGATIGFGIVVSFLAPVGQGNIGPSLFVLGLNAMILPGASSTGLGGSTGVGAETSILIAETSLGALSTPRTMTGYVKP